MCGIAGIVRHRASARPIERESLVCMAGALRHRGPDEFGIYRDAEAGLAHARLSIIDVATGQQPLGSEDQNLWIVFNGEIFNYIELRAELIARGRRFRTKSDTEVIVQAWEAWGVDAFSAMNGQWALALWDRRRKELVLARDRLGVRPLFLCEHDGRLLFASEVKAIFAADSSIPRAFDPLGLEETFTFWTVVPPRSVFHGITELRPGHVRIYGPEGVRESCIWEPSYAEEQNDGRNRFAGTLDDAVIAVRENLERATALRMLRADVPVGSYLSGGLDSSLVAALALRAKGERFSTFSLRFDDTEYDETQYQRMMVEHLGSTHQDVVVSRCDIATAFPQVVWHAERPILRTAPAPLFLLSRLVHEAGIKVVLTGEGADEMFAGYDLFREAKVRRFWARRPGSKLRPRLLERLYPYLARSPVSQQAMAQQFFGRNLQASKAPGFSHDPRWSTTGALKRLFSADQRAATSDRDVTADFLATLPEAFARWSPLSQDQYLEVRTLLSGYLLSSQGDRMLMAHSVEGRFPFLDRDVVELANSLPAEYKLRVLDEKHVLKRASADLIPEAILRRKKQPYRAPDALSFVGPDRPAWTDDMTSEPAVRGAGVFSARAVAKLWEKCRVRADEAQFSNADNMALVGVLSTQLLHDQFIRTAPDPGPPVPLRTVIER